MHSVERPKKPNTFKPEDFPFERLRLGNVETGFGYDKSKSFGTTHLYTFLISDKGKLEPYFVEFPALTGGPMSYYIPKDEKTGVIQYDSPSLYLRQDVHAKWAELGEDGKPSCKRLPRGIIIETFWKKFYTRCVELLREMGEKSPSDVVVLMGLKKSQQLDSCLNELVQFGTYPEKHKLKGLPNKERSEQFKTTPWIQKRSQMKTETLAKMEKLKPEEVLMIPGTEIYVYTAFYDNTPDSPCPGQRILGDWSPLKRFCFNGDRVENASHQYAEVMAYQTIQAPTLVFNPSKGSDGEIQCKPDLIVFTGYNPRVRDGSYTEAQMEHEKRKRQEDADELGFVQGSNELELATSDATGAGTTKHHRNNDGSVTKIEAGRSGSNNNTRDDDIEALGLQEEYAASQAYM